MPEVSGRAPSEPPPEAPSKPQEEAQEEAQEEVGPSSRVSAPTSDGGSARRQMWGSLAVIGLLLTFVVGKRVARLLSTRPSQQQCEELADHHLELASRQRHPDVDDEDVSRARERARGGRTHTTDVARCMRQLTASEVECALRAPHVDELERCLQ